MASKFPTTTTTLKRPATANGDQSHQQQLKRGHWSAALSDAINDEKVQVYKDDLCTVINDKYPKARIHLLVLPNEFIADLKSMNDSHVPLLKHMLKVGKEVSAKMAANANARGAFANFRYGYHAVPSMALLHMHVISQDFISDSMKTKRHWNSFTTDYFVDAADVIDTLQANKSFRVETERVKRLLDRDLECHRCSTPFKTIPKLKEHLLSHVS